MHRSPLALLDPLGDTSSMVAMEHDRDACRSSFAASLRSATLDDEPYRHWLLRDVLPADVAAGMDVRNVRGLFSPDSRDE